MTRKFVTPTHLSLAHKAWFYVCVRARARVCVSAHADPTDTDQDDASRTVEPRLCKSFLRAMPATQRSPCPPFLITAPSSRCRCVRVPPARRIGFGTHRTETVIAHDLVQPSRRTLLSFLGHYSAEEPEAAILHPLLESAQIKLIVPI